MGFETEPNVSAPIPILGKIVARLVYAVWIAPSGMKVPDGYRPIPTATITILLLYSYLP